MERPATPLWTWVLVGALAGLAWVERPPGRRAEPPPGARERWEPELDPTRMVPRDLRRLPGVGEKRAIDLARTRWQHRRQDGPLRFSDVRGIGPKTEGRIREWLTENGWTGDPLLARPLRE